jgi:hypothetical protein
VWGLERESDRGDGEGGRPHVSPFRTINLFNSILSQYLESKTQLENSNTRKKMLVVVVGTVFQIPEDLGWGDSKKFPRVTFTFKQGFRTSIIIVIMEGNTYKIYNLLKGEHLIHKHWKGRFDTAEVIPLESAYSYGIVRITKLN